LLYSFIVIGCKDTKKSGKRKEERGKRYDKRVNNLKKYTTAELLSSFLFPLST